MFDIHCHLDHPGLRPHIIKLVKSDGLTGVISSGIKRTSWEAHLELVLQKQWPINVSLGLHPFFVDEMTLTEVELLPGYLDEVSAIAVGEIGLDYHKETASLHELQKVAFQRQLKMAADRGLPAIIHLRKAFDDFWKIVKDVDVPLIFHAFSGGPDDLKKAVARHAMISFGFPITYDNNRQQTEMLSRTPLENLLLETDAPYMKKNQQDPKVVSMPLDIVEVYDRASHIKNISLDALKDQVRLNVKNTFANFKDIVHN